MAEELTVKQLLIEIEAQNNAEDELKSASGATQALAKDTDTLIGELKRGDAQFSAVAASLEKITNRELRAKEAVKAHTRAFQKQTGVLNKLSDTIQVANARLDSMGATGKVLKASIMAASAAVLALAAAIGTAAVASVKAYIESNEDAKKAADRLSDSFKKLQIQTGELIVGGDDLAVSMDRNAVRMDLFTESLDKAEAQGITFVSVADTIIMLMTGAPNVIDSATKSIDGLTAALDLLLGTQKEIEGEAEARKIGERALATHKKAVEAAKADLQLVKEQAAAKILIKKILVEDERKLVQKEEAARRRAQAAAAKDFASFSKLLDKIAQQSKDRAAALADSQEVRRKKAADIRKQEGIDRANALKAEMSRVSQDPQSDRLKRLTTLQNEFTRAQEISAKQAAPSKAAFDSLAATFVGLAEGLAAGEVSLKDAAKGMVSAFGDILIQLGLGIVLASEGLLALFSGNPIAALAGGLALIAGGIAIKAVLASGPKDLAAGSSGASARTTAPSFDANKNDFERRSEDSGKVINLFIGQEQIRGPITRTVEDVIRRGGLPELGGAF